jgi:hypothetical protein
MFRLYCQLLFARCSSPTSPIQARLSEKSADVSADFLFPRGIEGSSPIRMCVQIVENQRSLYCRAMLKVRILAMESLPQKALETALKSFFLRGWGSNPTCIFAKEDNSLWKSIQIMSKMACQSLCSNPVLSAFPSNWQGIRANSNFSRSSIGWGKFEPPQAQSKRETPLFLQVAFLFPVPFKKSAGASRWVITRYALNFRHANRATSRKDLHTYTTGVFIRVSTHSLPQMTRVYVRKWYLADEWNCVNLTLQRSRRRDLNYFHIVLIQWQQPS